MGRPRIEWTDTQLRQILNALPALDRDTRQDNARFLDGLIAVVRAATGRLYGATAYGKLLRQFAPQAGVERRPSSSTVQAAVLRAQSLATQPEAASVASRSASKRTGKKAPDGAVQIAELEISTQALRSALLPALREVLAPLPKRRARERATTGARAEGRDALQLRLTQAALADAHARIVQLEQDAARLRRALEQAEAARDLAGKHVNAMLEGLHRAINDRLRP